MGPRGRRADRRRPGGLLPAGIALAATWNTGLVEQVGQALGKEALTKGARVLRPEQERAGASSQEIRASARFTLVAERAEPTRAGLLAAM